MLDILFVGAGGFVGSILRYVVGLCAPSTNFPFATLGINIVGSFAIALIATLSASGVIADERVSLMLRVGLCGGFTTFSTFSLETMDLVQQGSYALAFAYAAVSCITCLAAAFAGCYLAKAMQG